MSAGPNPSRRQPPQYARKRTGKQQANRSRRNSNRILAILTGLVLLLLLCLLLLKQSRTDSRSTDSSYQENAATESSQVAGNQADTGDTQAVSATESLSQGTADHADGLSAQTALTVDLSQAVVVDLPDIFTQQGAVLTALMSDGRLLLNSGSHLGLWDPADQVYTEIAAADFGLQAAARGQLVVYGIGGDEMPQIFLWNMADSSQQTLLEDTAGGFYGLELDDQGNLYTTQTDPDASGKAAGAWLKVSLSDGQTQSVGSDQRDLALYQLSRIWPQVPLTWAYSNGQTWYEAVKQPDGPLFALQLTYVDTAGDLYRYSIAQVSSNSDGAGAGALQMILSDEEGGRPELSAAADLLVVNGRLAYDSSARRWYQLPATVSQPLESTARILGADSSGKNLYLAAATDKNGRFNRLIIVPEPAA
ncbi:hypothetical protein HCH52_02025 [Oscillospiraceae bacterium HV4-5-C5C]|nr:hypothetical protein [Oscillospiraceae bacterium HV4-5-C5C]